MKMQFDMIISGRVQHVGFRYYARARAEELELTGYVRNLPDGTLRVVAEGETSSLETFADHLRIGPSMARVQKLTLERSPFTGGFCRFDIRY
ncbi:MAG TPA: acylphosphatase [Prolixibacteraceae bacterium]|nr:acylphosphatase [Prolixibacteraceae bacterium]